MKQYSLAEILFTEDSSPPVLGVINRPRFVFHFKRLIVPLMKRLITIMLFVFCFPWLAAK